MLATFQIFMLIAFKFSFYFLLFLKFPLTFSRALTLYFRCVSFLFYCKLFIYFRKSCLCCLTVGVDVWRSDSHRDVFPRGSRLPESVPVQLARRRGTYSQSQHAPNSGSLDGQTQGVCLQNESRYILQSISRNLYSTSSGVSIGTQMDVFMFVKIVQNVQVFHCDRHQQ